MLSLPAGACKAYLGLIRGAPMEYPAPMRRLGALTVGAGGPTAAATA